MKDESNSHESTPNEDPTATGKTPSEKSWAERLAEKSTGLPETEKPAAPKGKETSPWKYAGLGLQFAGTVGLMAWFGYVIDQWRGWKNSPALLTLVSIGVIGSLYLLIKESMKANK